MSRVISAPRQMRSDSNKIIDGKWPLIIQAISANPGIGGSKLYKQFGIGIRSLAAFNQLCAERNIRDLRRTVKEKKITPKQSSIQLTEKAIELFKKEREDKGYLFLGRMGEMVEKNMKTLEKQAVRIDEGDDDYVDSMMPVHLDNLTKINKIGSSVYGLDREATVEDKQKLQLNVIMHFDPRQAKMKAASGIIIDQ